MSPKKFMYSIPLLSLSLAAAGCFGGGGDVSSSGKPSVFSRLKPGRKSDAVASSEPRKRRGKAKAGRGRNGNTQFASADSEEISLELSMKRDMEKLREKERKQAKTVEEMRRALGQGEDMVVKEESKLKDIRSQIARYDGEIRRFEMASAGRAKGSRVAPRPQERYADSADSVVPVSMYTDPGRQGNRNFAPADYSQPRGQYAPQPREYARYERPHDEYVENPYGREPQRDYPRENRPVRYDRGGEKVLYDGGARAPQPARNSGYDERRYAESRPRGPAPAPARRPAENDGEVLWNPPSGLFSDNSTPMTVPPRTRSAPPSRENVRPSSPAPQPQRRAPAPQREEYGSEEVFTPDLYLTR